MVAVVLIDVVVVEMVVVEVVVLVEVVDVVVVPREGLFVKEVVVVNVAVSSIGTELLSSILSLPPDDACTPMGRPLAVKLVGMVRMLVLFRKDKRDCTSFLPGNAVFET